MLVPIDAFDLDKLPAHLRVTFAVESADGTEVARGKDLEALQEQLAAPARQAVAEAVADGLERSGLRGWPDDLDELPRTVERVSGGHTVRGYPAFVDAGSAVDVRVFATTAEQDAAMGPGIAPAAAAVGAVAGQKRWNAQLDPRTRLVLGANPGRLAERAARRLRRRRGRRAGAGAGVEPGRVRRAAGAGGRRAGADDARHRRPGGEGARRRTRRAARAARPPPAAQADAIADIRAQLRPAAAARLRHRHRRSASRRPHPLPHRHRPAARAVAAGASTPTASGWQRVHAVQDAYDELRAAHLSPAARPPTTSATSRGRSRSCGSACGPSSSAPPRPVSEQRIYRAIDAITP